MGIENKVRTVAEGLLWGVMVILAISWLETVGCLPEPENTWPNISPEIDLIPEQDIQKESGLIRYS